MKIINNSEQHFTINDHGEQCCWIKDRGITYSVWNDFIRNEVTIWSWEDGSIIYREEPGGSIYDETYLKYLLKQLKKLKNKCNL